MSARHEVNGVINRAIGTLKEKFGRLTGSRSMEAQGTAEKTVGKVEQGIGRADRKLDKAADDLRRM